MSSRNGATAIRVLAVVEVSDNVRDKMNVGHFVEVKEIDGTLIQHRIFLNNHADFTSAFDATYAVFSDKEFTLHSMV